MALLLLYLAMSYTSSIAKVNSLQPFRHFLNGSLGLQTKDRFTKVPDNDVIFTNDVIQETSVRSKVDCGRRCAGDDQCVMYTFWKSPGTCRLYGQVQNADGYEKKASGAKSYARDLIGCTYDGYGLRKGRCIQVLDGKMSYQEGTDRCNELGGGHLLYIKNQYDLEFVQEFMEEINLKDVWVGADDRAVEGEYKWADETPLLANSSLWKNGQGDCNDNEDCVFLKDWKEKLHDKGCHENHHIICQRNV